MQNGYTSRVNTRHGINVRTAYWNDDILSPEQVKINVQFLVNIRHQNIRTFSDCGRHKQLQGNIYIGKHKYVLLSPIMWKCHQTVDSTAPASQEFLLAHSGECASRSP